MARDEKSGYYDAGGIEVQDVIKAKLTPEQYEGWLLGNVIKYSLRCNFKGTSKRDQEKIANYATWLRDETCEPEVPEEVRNCENCRGVCRQYDYNGPVCTDFSRWEPGSWMYAEKTEKTEKTEEHTCPTCQHNYSPDGTEVVKCSSPYVCTAYSRWEPLTRLQKEAIHEEE